MMWRLDIFTVLVLTALALLTVSVALPLLMGRRPSRAARLAQFALLSQAGGWACIIAANFWPGHWLDLSLSTTTMALASLASWLLFQALAEWLGPRPGRRLLLVLGVLLPLGYALGFEHYSLRVGWANFLLAAQLLVVARASLWPRRPARRHWRWLLSACHVLIALFTLGRGVLGAFFPELYPYFQAPHPINVGAQVATNVVQTLVTVAVLVAWRDEAEERLRTLASTDGLTGVLNHRAWHEQAQGLLATAQRHGQPLAVLLLDLDHFKAVNDQRGHEVGDQALALFARLLREQLREGDLCGRLGGEEFAVALNQGGVAAAQALDQRLRQALRQRSPVELGFELGYSAGAARLQAEDRSMRELLSRADQALYRAKAGGRGRLLLSPDVA